MNINSIDDLLRLAGIVKTQQQPQPAAAPIVTATVPQQPEDMYSILAKLDKLDTVHGDDDDTCVGEWANTPAETGEPESRVMDQPKGEPVDTSLRRYLGAKGQPVSVEETQIKDHTFESLSDEYRIFKESKAKPDFLDLDKDGDKTEPMKKAVSDKKKKSVKEAEGKVYRHKGTYGTSYDPSDEEKAELAKKDDGVKRGRGRPKKGSDASGEVKSWDWSAFGVKSAKDAKLPKWKGNVTKHKIADE